MTRLEDVWPLFGLQISTPRLALNPVRDEQLPGLIDAVLAGIHDPAVMPFGVPWTDAPREDLIRGTAQHQWRQRCTVEPENWTLNLAVCREGRVIGVQDLSARDLSIQRQRCQPDGRTSGLCHHHPPRPPRRRSLLPDRMVHFGDGLRCGARLADRQLGFADR